MFWEWCVQNDIPVKPETIPGGVTQEEYKASELERQRLLESQQEWGESLLIGIQYHGLADEPVHSVALLDVLDAQVERLTRDEIKSGMEWLFNEGYLIKPDPAGYEVCLKIEGASQ